MLEEAFDEADRECHVTTLRCCSQNRSILGLLSIPANGKSASISYLAVSEAGLMLCMVPCLAVGLVSVVVLEAVPSSDVHGQPAVLI